MTIDEAIRTLDDWKRDNCPPPLADELNALKLGIEALKFVKMTRTTQEFRRDTLLPGETEK